jgi:hypothetical protein
MSDYLCLLCKWWITTSDANHFWWKNQSLLGKDYRCKIVFGLWLPFHNEWKSFFHSKDMPTICLKFLQWCSGKNGSTWNQKLIWLIDCWSVNKFGAFISWVKTEFPFSCVLFVPTNCALKLQPDVILHRPLKCEFTTLQKMVYVNNWSLELDLRIGTLGECFCTWLFEAWKVVGCSSDMIINRW